MGSQMVDLQTGVSRSVPDATGTPDSVPKVFTVGTSDLTAERVRDQIDDLKAIYPEPSSGLGTAMRIIAESIDFCVKAIEAERAGDRMSADEFMLHAQALLPELVSVQRLGDGFGIVVAALVFLFANMSGAPFSSEQMFAVLKSYRALWTSPFLSQDSAVTITDDLEDANLAVDPLPLTELFNDAEEAGLVDR